LAFGDRRIIILRPIWLHLDTCIKTTTKGWDIAQRKSKLTWHALETSTANKKTNTKTTIKTTIKILHKTSFIMKKASLKELYLSLLKKEKKSVKT
jgi:hypothetical protein